MQKLNEGLYQLQGGIRIVEGEEELKPTCDVCGGSGMLSVPGYHAPDGVWISNKVIPCTNPNCPIVLEQQRERFAKLSAKASIPLEYQHFTFEAWERLKQFPAYLDGKRDAYGAALAFTSASENRFMFTLRQAAQMAKLAPNPELDNEGEKNSIVFSGVNGIGKTSLAVSIANALLDQRVPVLYVRTADVLAAVKERFDQSNKPKEFEFDWGNTEQAIIGNLQSVPVLVLDEFGVSQYTDWRRDTIEQIVRYRYSNQKATILTTNLGYDELADDLHWRRATGHAVHGMAHWLTMSGLELRRRNGAVQSR